MSSTPKKPSISEDNWLYIKTSDGYQKVRVFEGFPSNGIWAVYRDDFCSSKTNIAKLGEFSNPLPLADMVRYEREACTAVNALLTTGHYSVRDIVRCVCSTITKAHNKKVVRRLKGSK